MINKAAVIATLVIFGMFALIIWIAFHFYGKTISQQSEISTATQAKNQAEFVAENQSLTIGILNTIAEANINAKQTMRSDVEVQIVTMQTAVKDDACAVKPVPVAAADSLRRQADGLRKDSINATTGKPAG